MDRLDIVREVGLNRGKIAVQHEQKNRLDRLDRLDRVGHPNLGRSRVPDPVPNPVHREAVQKGPSEAASTSARLRGGQVHPRGGPETVAFGPASIPLPWRKSPGSEGGSPGRTSQAGQEGAMIGRPGGCLGATLDNRGPAHASPIPGCHPLDLCRPGRPALPMACLGEGADGGASRSRPCGRPSGEGGEGR